ncbi:MAG TPA: prepilin-type N-terminal cleavage/methylation domain-containing protein [Patescibacteria group bacterium]|jgi:type II secretory pathway pseudopilin PulG|nr:prepilin-type N-terminal cleavage/methylation domain-containing protein [Patescibacteria group bacterium]
MTNQMNDHHSQSGFTLIETIIYIGLLVLIMSAVILATYNMIASTDKSQYRSLIHNDAQFAVRKLSWTLNGASSVTISGTAPNQTLTIHYPSPTADKVIDLNSGKIRVGGTPLNGDIAPVTSLTFTTNPAQVGVTPVSRPVEVQMVFEMKNIYYDETFTTKKLVR